MNRSIAIKFLCLGLVMLTGAVAGIYITKNTMAPVPAGPKAVKPATAISMLFGAVGNKVVDKYVFTDQNGKPFEVNQWFDKPLIISFMFSQCPEVCPTITASLSAFANRNGGALGERLRIVSIGFDTENDSPEAMNNFGAQFTDSFEGWKFLSGSPKTVNALADKLGVTFKKDENGQWLHTVGVTLMGPGGAVVEQILGQDYSDRQILPYLDRIEKGKL